MHGAKKLKKCTLCYKVIKFYYSNPHFRSVLSLDCDTHYCSYFVKSPCIFFHWGLCYSTLLFHQEALYTSNRFQTL